MISWEEAYERIGYYEDAPAESLAELYDRRYEVAAYLSRLSTRQRRVLEFYYGLNGPEMSIKEIASRFDVTPDRIRQIYNKAMGKLRHPATSEALSGWPWLI